MTEGDNFKVDVRAHSLELLDKAIEIIMTHRKVARSFGKPTKGGLVLYWTDAKTLEKVEEAKTLAEIGNLPFEMGVVGVKAMVREWLAAQDQDRASEPDLDGHCSPGFHITSGAERAFSYQIFTVKRSWTEFHK